MLSTNRRTSGDRGAELWGLLMVLLLGAAWYNAGMLPDLPENPQLVYRSFPWP